MDIAIIGMVANFPKAPDHYALWQQLLKNYDAVQEIPLNRWNWHEFYGDPKKSGVVSDVKYAAFIDDIDKFDASFFKISPREAKLMDPRQRLLLQAVWSLFEDAGYSPENFSGKKVCIYVGATGDDYQTQVLSLADDIDSYTLTGTSRTILANRISHFFNFSAESEVIDTACSSSLVAVDKAVQNIISGRSELAIAGGINLIIDPMPHISLTKIGMLTADGQCKVFDKSANGYVRGEGYGLILLKPLKEAIKDNDSIYAVIKSTVINHDGKSNSLTAPSPAAQQALLLEAYTKANVDVESIGYIEAHGTGTALGDPIEVNSILVMFDELYHRQQKSVNGRHCALGSIKSNIGHLEAAAGIAGLIKLALSLKYKMLLPTNHLTEINPFIEDRDPVYFLDKSTSWPKISFDKNMLRVGGVSSFGFGGVNSHVVLSEVAPQDTPLGKADKKHIILLSSDTQEQLSTMKKGLAEFLQSSFAKNYKLEDIAYTLQVGRKHFKERFSCIVDSIDELVTILKNEKYNVPKSVTMYDSANVKQYIQEIHLEALMYLWLQKSDIDWKKLYDNMMLPSRVSLPTYVFKKDRYWVDNNKEIILHDCIKNIINESPDVFKVTLLNSHPAINAHRVQGKLVFPGVGFICLMQKISKQMLNNDGYCQIKGLVWIRPLYIDDKKETTQLIITVTDKGDRGYLCKILDAVDSKIIFCQAYLQFLKVKLLSTIEPSPIAELEKYELNKGDVLKILSDVGFSHDTYYQTMESMIGNDQYAIGAIPWNQSFSQTEFIYALLDSLLQASIVYEKVAKLSGSEVKIPYSLDEFTMDMDNNFTEGQRWYVHVKSNGNKLSKCDLLLVNDEGKTVVSMTGLYGRSIVGIASDKVVVNYYEETWLPFITQDYVADTTTDNTILLVLPPPTMVAELRNSLKSNYKNIVSATISQARSKLNDDTYEINFDNIEDFEWLLQDLKSKNLIPQHIILFVCGENSSLSFHNLFNPAKIVFGLNKAILKQLISYDIGVLVVSIMGRGSKVSSVAHRALESLCLNSTLEHKRLKEKYLFLDTDEKIKKFVNNVKDINYLETLLRSDDRKYSFIYQDDTIFYKQLKLSEQTYNQHDLFRAGGCYLITGATGGLAPKVAKYISQKVNVKFILVGRRSSTPAIRELIEFLEQHGSTAIYHQTDITNKKEVKQLIKAVKQQFNQLNGVIHCAGMIGDSLLFNKSLNKFLDVIGPKVSGTIFIDEETKQENLDFFMMFSSLVTYVGHVGQTDYAYANSFINNYAKVREELRTNGLRHGPTIAVSWSVWENGGMNFRPDEIDRIKRTIGVTPLTDDIGLQVFYNALLSNRTNTILAYGDTEKINKNLIKI